MDEIELELENELPFCELSRRFPEIEFYRWCNSAVDYLEFYGESGHLERLLEFMPSVEHALQTEIIFTSLKERSLSMMLSCRCSPVNSAIRMAESRNLMWKAPVFYSGGHEKLSLLSPLPGNIDDLFHDLERIGKVAITKKFRIDPQLIRDNYTLSLSQIFSSLTAKQMRYLVSAFNLGYFDIPRKTQISSMARGFGISYSSLQEHIEKATSKILKGLEPYLSLDLHIRENDEGRSKPQRK